MNIYELNRAYRDLNDLADRLDLAEQEGEDVTEIKDQLVKEFDFAEGLIESKLENMCKLVKNLDIESKQLEAESKRLTKRKKARDNQILFIKEKLIRPALENMNKEKLDLGIFKLGFRKSKSLQIMFEDKIPELFKEVRETLYIDKLAIKKAINEGEEIEGVEMIENKSLQIK